MSSTSAYSILLKKEDAHDEPIYCCSWAKTNTTGDPKAPLKDYIATGGLDCLVKVWLLENNRLELVHSLAGHEMAVVSLAISSDGHTIASSSLDSNLVIWDLVSGNKVHQIQDTGTDVWNVAFSPDGQFVVTGSHTGILCVYDIETASMEKFLDTRGRFALSVAWSADGKQIASGSVNGMVCLFDAEQLKLVHTTQVHVEAVNSIAFSPDSQLVIIASADGNVDTYNIESASVHSTIKLKSRAMAACFSPDGTRAAVGLGDGSVTVSLIKKLQKLNVFEEHSDAVCGVQFNAEGNKLLTVSKDKCIHIYECPIPPKAVAKK